MVGTGEYTTGSQPIIKLGFVSGQQSASDKKIGVVGLSLFYLRSRGVVGRLLMAGVNGTKYPGIREHFRQNIAGVYRDLADVSFESFPADDIASDPASYLKVSSQLPSQAMDTMKRGDLVTIFTPDDTHYDIGGVLI